MPLQLKTAETKNPAKTELYIEFLNATGAYSVSNTGGFGTPNPARNTLAVLFYGNYKPSAGDVLATPAVYDPLTVSTFTFAITPETNGHLNGYLFALAIYDPMGSYTDGDVVWDNTTNPVVPVVKKRISGSFQTVTLESLIDDAEATQVEFNSLITVEAEKFQNELSADRLPYLRDILNEDGCETTEYKTARNNYDYVDSLLEAVFLDYSAQAYSEAVLKLEEISDFQESYNAQQ